MTTEIRIIADIICKVGHEGDARRVILECVAPTKNEPGCMEYTIQASTQNPQMFVFIERWKDQAALELHVKTTHFLHMVEQLAPLLERGFEVEVLLPVG